MFSCTVLLDKFSSAIFQLFSTFQFILSRGLAEGLYTGFNSVLDSLSWVPPFLYSSFPCFSTKFLSYYKFYCNMFLCLSYLFRRAIQLRHLCLLQLN